MTAMGTGGFPLKETGSSPSGQRTPACFYGDYMKPNPSTLSLSGFKAKAGFTLVETMIAVALSCATLSTVMVLNAQQLKLVKSSRETNAASLVLQDRVEQMRILTWNNLTNPNYV